MSQLLSSGPPATPSCLPLRSFKLLIAELGGTMRAPSSLLKGEKVTSAPELRSRDTHSQSVTIRSSERLSRPTLVASVLASGLTSRSMPSALSNPLCWMVSKSQLKLPNFSAPILIFVAARVEGQEPRTVKRMAMPKTSTRSGFKPRWLTEVSLVNLATKCEVAPGEGISPVDPR